MSEPRNVMRQRLERQLKERDDVIVELQHRHRGLVHGAKSNAAFARGILQLIERDGFEERRLLELRILVKHLLEHAFALSGESPVAPGDQPTAPDRGTRG